MSKWCVVIAMGLFMTLPAVAQNKAGDTGDSGNAPAAVADSTAASATTSEAASVAPAASNIFAVPMPPRATPFPAPSPSLGISGAPAQQVPKIELAFLFQYVNFVPGSAFNNFNSFGGSGEIAYNANHWLGLVAQGAGYTFTRDLTPIAAQNPQYTNPSAV